MKFVLLALTAQRLFYAVPVTYEVLFARIPFHKFHT